MDRERSPRPSSGFKVRFMALRSEGPVRGRRPFRGCVCLRGGSSLPLSPSSKVGPIGKSRTWAENESL